MRGITGLQGVGRKYEQKHEFTHLCYFQAQAGGAHGVIVPPGRDPLLGLLAARWD